MDENVKKVLSRLEAQCAKREYCVSEIKAKLSKTLGEDEESISEVMDSLIRDKYVDNLRYATAFSREKSSIGGWGGVKIAMGLRAKGIDNDTIRIALAEIDGERATERLKRLLLSKKHSLTGDPYWKLKLIRYALGRGYGYDEVNKALDLIEEDGQSQ